MSLDTPIAWILAPILMVYGLFRLRFALQLHRGQVGVTEDTLSIYRSPIPHIVMGLLFCAGSIFVIYKWFTTAP